MTSVMIRNMCLGLLLWGLATGIRAAELEGQVQWLQRAELGTPVSGVVQSVAVFPGERVRQGQVLVELDARAFKANLARARAQLSQMKESLAEARRELERSTELYDRTLLSDHDLQVAKIAAINAEADYQAARADLVNAELDVEYSRLKAPFEGIVLERHVEPGEVVVSRLQSSPLLVLASSAELVVRAEVPTTVMENLKQGQALTVQLAGERYPGAVHRLGPEPLGEGRYALEVRFSPKPGHTLYRGQAARILLP